MQRIQEAQEETSNELENALERLAKTKIRNAEAHARAVDERKSMANEIEDVKKELQDAVLVLLILYLVLSDCFQAASY